MNPKYLRKTGPKAHICPWCSQPSPKTGNRCGHLFKIAANGVHLWYWGIRPVPNGNERVTGGAEKGRRDLREENQATSRASATGFNQEMKAMNEMNETTIERLTKAGRKLGLTGCAGQNGYLYYWAHGSSCTDLDATNYAGALKALEREAALLEECEKAEEQYFNDLVKEYALAGRRRRA